LEQAEGYPKKAGLIDLQVAKFFAEYIDWELDHPELMKEALGLSEYFKKIEVDQPERHRRYHFLIDHELTDSMEILDQAMARLDSDKKWPKLKDIEWDKIKYQDGYFRYNGVPVFFGGFNVLSRGMTDLSQYPEWAERDTEMTRSLMLKMQKLGVGIVGSGASIPRLITEDGSIDKPRIQELAERIRQYGEMGFKVDILLYWKGDKETLEKFWPGITEYYGNGVYLDIDHPGTKVMISQVMAELMPVLKDVDAIASWDLANEPFFNMKMWSKHTLQKYHAWLADKYKTIEQLNAVWKTGFRNFDEIPLPKEQTAEQFSAGQWYDRVTFHNYRVTQFFELVQSQIVKYIPDAVIHLKGQDNSSLGPLDGAVTDGIDREMLTPLASLHGVDTRPLPITEPRMAAGNKGQNPNKILHYDDSPYGFHWLGQSFLYDYLTSLKPYRPVIDFEYHAFSINPIRIPDIKQSHATASLWMAHLHGLVGNIAWYWHQRYGPYPFPHEHYKVWFYGSISTQPLIAAEYFHTMLKLNAFSQEVAALATVAEKPIRIFVSKPSYIQNRAHIDALHRVYEGVCFHGLPMGFVTEDILTDSGVAKDCKLIIIPDAEYISADALQVLKSAKNAGVKLVRFGKIRIAYNEHGHDHSPESIAFLDDVQVFDYADAPALSKKFEKLLSPMTVDLPLRVTDSDGRNAFGVMHRQTILNGKRILLLVNVSDKPVQVQLRWKDGRPVDGFDMLNSEAVKGSGVTMPFQSVRLIKIEL
jgi:beta-galactosidase